MNKTRVGKDASQQAGSGLYFRTYQKLLKQRGKIDKELAKMQTKLLRVATRNRVVISGQRVKYVDRLENTKPLFQAIRESMTPNKEMTMKDIIKSLTDRGLYHTNSKYIYTMINNKLNRDPKIKKVRRGVFSYRPRPSRSKVKPKVA